MLAIKRTDTANSKAERLQFYYITNNADRLKVPLQPIFVYTILVN